MDIGAFPKQSTSEIAPVALFIFNRPQLTATVYERIRAIRPKKFLVIADGPRLSRTGEDRLCQQTRKVVTSPDWPCELVTNFASENLGCKRRVSSGLDWVFQQCSEAIILEDDCLPSSSFFCFCSEMLNRYRDNDRIMHVSGNNFQDGKRKGNASYYFSKYTHSWGWASWKRAWQHYDVKISDWPIAYRQRWLQSFLDIPDEVTYWEAIFDRLYRGEIDTWDYQWLFSCWRQGGLSILPNRNLVTNIGAGPDATHFKREHSTIGLPAHEIGELTHACEIALDKEADRYTFEKYIANQRMPMQGNLLQKIKGHIAFKARMKALLPRSLRYRSGTGRWRA